MMLLGYGYWLGVAIPATYEGALDGEFISHGLWTEG